METTDIKNLGQFIQHMAIKAGMALDDYSLIDVLSNTYLQKCTINPDLVKQFDENLLSIGEALEKQPTIKNKWIAEVLNPLDKRMRETIDDLELDDNSKAELKNVRRSYDRFDALMGKLKEEALSAGDDNGATDEEMLEQLNGLQADLLKVQTDHAEEMKQYQEQINSYKIEYGLRAEIDNSHRSMLDTLPTDVKSEALYSLVKNHLTSAGLRLQVDENNKLKAYDDHGLSRDLKPIIESLLAEKKLLEVTNMSKVFINDHTKEVVADSFTSEPAKDYGMSVSAINKAALDSLKNSNPK